MKEGVLDPWQQLARYQEAASAPPEPPAPRRHSRLNLLLEPGATVGEWTLLEYMPGARRQGQRRVQAKWKCQCSCGAVRWVRACNLLASLRGDGKGTSRSCGHDNPFNRHL